MQRTNLLFLLFAGVILAAACSPNAGPNSQQALLGLFRTAAAPDSLIFEVEQEEGVTTTVGDTIPNGLFFTVLDSALLAGINHVADSSMAVVLARKRFSLNSDFDACLVDIRQHWFQHQSLLLYNRRKNAFIGRVTVAEWYGGDGGQVLTGCWLVDYDSDGDKDLVVREINHTLRPDENGEAIDETYETAALWLWQSGGFVEQPLSDTTGLVRRYPIRSFW